MSGAFTSALVIGPTPSGDTNAAAPCCIKVLAGRGGTNAQQSIVLARDAALLKLVDSQSCANTPLLGPLLSKPFAFDRVLDASGESPYVAWIRARVARAMDGQNLLALAYGDSAPTRTNKSDTMTGEGGIVPTALRDLFHHMQQRSSPSALYQLSASLVHVHNDQLRDLFNFDGLPLKILTDEEGTEVSGSRRVRIKSLAQVDEITQLFIASSKTAHVHTVLTLQVDHLDLERAAELQRTGQASRLPTCVHRVSKLQFVELASSELALAQPPGPQFGRSIIPRSSTHAPRDADSLAARRHSRDPTLVKQAQREVDARRRSLVRSSPQYRGGSPAVHAPKNTYVPTVDFEQKTLCKTFEALEQVLFQLATKPAPKLSSDAFHISYRGHKLTWLLADTLRVQQDANEIVLLSFVAPPTDNIETTLATCRFGARIAEWFAKKRDREADAKARRLAAAKAATLAACTIPAPSAMLLGEDEAEHRNSLLGEMQRHLDEQQQQQPPSLAQELDDAIPRALLNSRHEHDNAHQRPTPTPPPQPQQEQPTELDEYLARTQLRLTQPLPISIVPAPTSTEEHKYPEPAPSYVPRLQHQPQPQQPQQQLVRQTSQQLLAADRAARLASMVPPPVTVQPSQPPFGRSTARSTTRSSSVSRARSKSTSRTTSASSIFTPTPVPAPSPPLPTSMGPAPSATGLPTRLFDVLELLKHAKFGLRREAPCADWPYHKDVILNELTEQLAAWHHKTASNPQDQPQQPTTQSQPTQLPQFPAEEPRREHPATSSVSPPSVRSTPSPANASDRRTSLGLDGDLGGAFQRNVQAASDRIQQHQHHSFVVPSSVERRSSLPSLFNDESTHGPSTRATSVVAPSNSTTPSTTFVQPHRPASTALTAYSSQHEFDLRSYAPSPQVAQPQATSASASAAASVAALPSVAPSSSAYAAYASSRPSSVASAPTVLPSSTTTTAVHSDPWLAKHVLNVKAEMAALASQLRRLEHQLPPHSAGTATAAASVASPPRTSGSVATAAAAPSTPGPASTLSPFDSVSVSPGARTAASVDSFATYRSASGEVTTFFVRPASSSSTLPASAPTAAYGFSSPPLASLPFDNASPNGVRHAARSLARAPSIHDATFHTPPGATSHVASSSSRRGSSSWLESEFNHALADQSQLQRTLDQAQRQLDQRRLQRHSSATSSARNTPPLQA